MKSDPKKLLKKHQNLIQSDHLKVTSHVQRPLDDGWILHTLMIDKISTPFTFKRQQSYRSLAGQRVNLTYYTDKNKVAGMDFEVFKVVRVKIA